MINDYKWLTICQLYAIVIIVYVYFFNVIDGKMLAKTIILQNPRSKISRSFGREFTTEHKTGICDRQLAVPRHRLTRRFVTSSIIEPFNFIAVQLRNSILWFRSITQERLHSNRWYMPKKKQKIHILVVYHTRTIFYIWLITLRKFWGQTKNTLYHGNGLFPILILFNFSTWKCNLLWCFYFVAKNLFRERERSREQYDNHKQLKRSLYYKYQHL